MLVPNVGRININHHHLQTKDVARLTTQRANVDHCKPNGYSTRRGSTNQSPSGSRTVCFGTKPGSSAKNRCDRSTTASPSWSMYTLRGPNRRDMGRQLAGGNRGVVSWSWRFGPSCLNIFHVAPQSEMIRAILLEYSPCWSPGPAHRRPTSASPPSSSPPPPPPSNSRPGSAQHPSACGHRRHCHFNDTHPGVSH